MYRVYIRDTNQRVYHKLETYDNIIARGYYTLLKKESRFVGTKMLAVLNCDGQHVAKFSFYNEQEF